MKRLLLLALTVGLLGCEPNESNQQQISATADFAEAERQLRQAVAGTIDQPVKDHPKLRPIKHLVTVRPYGKTVAEFRNEKLAEPLAKLEKLARDPKGRPYQKVAASRAAAEILRGQARFAGEAAARSWSDQLDRAASLINDSSAVRFHQRVAAEQNKIDFTDLLTKLRAQEEQRAQAVAQLTTATTQFNAQAEKLKADIVRFNGERDKQILEADKLNAKAFTAKGQERYDLQVLAAKAKRSSDTFTRQADEAAAKLDPITTALKIDRSKLEAARAQLDQVRDSITKLNERIQEKNQLAGAADKAAQEAAESFETTFAAIAATQEKDVDARFDEAEAAATKASEMLEQAVRSASSDTSGLTRLHVDLDLHSTWATLGFIQQQKAMVNFAYNRTLRQAATTVRAALPQQARVASEAAGDADLRSAHAIERARDNFGFALENLEKLAESAKAGSQAELEQVARAQARDVREALATIEKGPKPTPTAVAQARAALPKRGEVAPPVAVTPTTPTTPTPPTAGAGTPAAAIQAVVDGLAANKPVVLWEALPASYQKQVNDLVRAYGAKVDEDLYNQGFALVGKVVGVLKNKKQFILNSPMLAGNPAAQSADLAGNWDKGVAILETLTGSELSNHSALATFDVGNFLSGTGTKLMRQVADATKSIPDNPLAELSQMRFTDEIDANDPDSAKITAIKAGQSQGAEDFRKVEGKWVPADLVDMWPQMLAQAQAAVANMSPEQQAQMKTQALMGISMVTALLDQLEKAESQDQFNQIIMGMMGQFGGGPGGPGPGGPGAPGRGLPGSP